MYEPYTVVRVEATIPEGNLFLGWSDGNLSNPRDVVMTKDTHLKVITQWGQSDDGGDDDDEDAEDKKYTVRFLDWNNTLLKQQIVKKGGNATPPNDPTREGYVFIGWKGDYTNVQEDLDIFARYRLSEGLEDPNEDASVVKFLRNGHIYIWRGSKLYTVTGQEVKK